ncbi:MAG: tripartite tricarboxylate transporter substrate binding protein [Proteobacteria bacterium]|nr:tripartite tricarboxylate transporter substrate binding protein [Pseudomonadota bacterium]
MHRKLFLRSTAAVLLGAPLASALAQTASFPSKPMRIVVPFPPGGGVDMIARLIGDKLTAQWGQPVVIENKPGAGTLIAAQAVASAAADGYTLMAATVDTLAVAAALQPKPVTLPEKTLTPVTQIVRTPLFIAVRPDSPFTGLPQLIEAARKAPGALSYGSAGIGTSHHMAMELLGIQAKIEVKHVPYRGSSPALSDLFSGVLDFAVLDSPVAVAQLKGGKIRVLAISTEARSPIAPEVPTIAEQGFPGFSALSWMGFAVAVDTPPAIVDKLHAGIRAAVESPDVAQRLRAIGLEPVVSASPADFKRYVDAERSRWTALIKAKNIQGE